MHYCVCIRTKINNFACHTGWSGRTKTLVEEDGGGPVMAFTVDCCCATPLECNPTGIARAAEHGVWFGTGGAMDESGAPTDESGAAGVTGFKNPGAWFAGVCGTVC